MGHVIRRDWEEHQEKFSAAPLREARISEDMRPPSVAQLAGPASQALSLSLCGVLFIPSTHHVSSTCLASAWVLPQQCIQPARVHRVPTNAAQLHNARGTNTCASLAKNPSSCILHMLALAEHPLSCVCFSETFLHETALVFHLYPLQ